MLSIVIPTYNERHNVEVIAERIDRVLTDKGIPYEIIFVDDSTDDTVDILSALAHRCPQVRYLHRTGRKGLGTAVVEGFALARGEYLAVMDADLQHPPELLPVLYNRLEHGFELAIASRFVPGGSDGGLSSPFRRLVSHTARLIGQMALKRLRQVHDPMSGYFMLRREVVEGVELNPIGWKILAEIIVKGRYEKICEVPYHFQPRLQETSKMNLNEQINYLRHVVRLVLESPEDLRFWKFCLVGLSGVFVNMFLFVIFTRLFAMGPVAAAFWAALLAMFSNFVLNDHFTWEHRREQFWTRMVKFYLFCGIGVLINAAVLAMLHGLMHVQDIAANMAGIMCATLWNYYSNSRWTWSGHRVY